MVNKNYTETELMGRCLACALVSEPTSFGFEQAKLANAEARRIWKAGECSETVYDAVSTRLGNHSQLRQWAVACGLIKTDKTSGALYQETAKALAAMNNNIANMANNPPPPSKK